MEDIRLAAGLIGFLSIGMFALVFRLLNGRSNNVLDLSALVVVGLIMAYMHTVWGQLWIVQWIPLPSVIILSNWFPPLLGALSAVVWLKLDPEIPDDATEEETDHLYRSAIWRKVPITVVLVCAAIYSVSYFIPRQPPECGDKWLPPPNPQLVWPVCMQTTPHTCSAAAAATILNTLGIQASEQEMAQLCLTKSGTTWLGLYHGLSTKLLGTDRRVEFFEGRVDAVSEYSKEHPLLLCCRLDPEIAEKEPRYVQNGWIPGTPHSVTYFGSINGVHIVGDPSMGYEAWTEKDLKNLWTGEGLRIARHNLPVAQSE